MIPPSLVNYYSLLCIAVKSEFALARTMKRFFLALVYVKAVILKELAVGIVRICLVLSIDL
jgi:hypothetical protein